MQIPCSACKKPAPKWCARRECPLFPKASIPAKQSFAGVTPNLFIGSYGYPTVNVGVLAAEEYSGNDDPRGWSSANTSILDIVRLRSSLVNSTKQVAVATKNARVQQSHATHTLQQNAAPVGTRARTADEEMRSLLAQSTVPVSVDVQLAKAPVFTTQYPTGSAPVGPSVPLTHAELTQNVHVPTDVEKVLSDELLATEQLTLLHKRHDEYYLQKLFSAGLLGKSDSQRLVPTRWSITATDDTLGKEHLRRIRELPVLGETHVFVGGHYGNTYCILLLAHAWQYELFEILAGDRRVEGKNSWTDAESFGGRTQYAADTVGGYYAARLSITEQLLRMKQQAAVLAFRFVDDSYTHPLGVWVVREAVKKALATRPLRFGSTELALEFVRVYASKKCLFNIEPLVAQSTLLRSLSQKTLSSFERA
jgi:hypothetical protein